MDLPTANAISEYQERRSSFLPRVSFQRIVDPANRTVAPEEAVQIVLPQVKGHSRELLPARPGATAPSAGMSIGQAVELSEEGSRSITRCSLRVTRPLSPSGRNGNGEKAFSSRRPDLEAGARGRAAKPPVIRDDSRQGVQRSGGSYVNRIQRT